MRAKKAFLNFTLWLLVVVVINILIYFFMGYQKSLEFLSGYIIELSLSVDNLFLFLMIFLTFNIPEKFQKRVLNFGIIGAIVLRLVFIALGISIISKFHYLLYIFGFFLILSGINVLFLSHKEKDVKENIIIRITRKILPCTEELHGEKFFYRDKFKIYATPLFLVLILIEFSDIVFALDSIPAIFSITTDPVIVYSSNILAILCLRSLYFLIVKINDTFKHIKYGIGCILIFTGIKLSILFFGIGINILVSLLIIVIILLSSMLASLVFS